MRVGAVPDPGGHPVARVAPPSSQAEAGTTPPMAGRPTARTAAVAEFGMMSSPTASASAGTTSTL